VYWGWGSISEASRSSCPGSTRLDPGIRAFLAGTKDVDGRA
jgi:hypothetical protein